MIHPERLFSLTGAESMRDDPADVYETWAADGVDRSAPLVIEEWTVHPPSYHLPIPAAVVDWAVDWAGDELTEFGLAHYAEVGRRPVVVEAFRKALNVFAAEVDYLMADELIATHAVTWDADGNPLYDGEPMYRPAKTQ